MFSWFVKQKGLVVGSLSSQVPYQVEELIPLVRYLFSSEVLFHGPDPVHIF